MFSDYIYHYYDFLFPLFFWMIVTPFYFIFFFSDSSKCVDIYHLRPGHSFHVLHCTRHSFRVLHCTRHSFRVLHCTRHSFVYSTVLNIDRTCVFGPVFGLLISDIGISSPTVESASFSACSPPLDPVAQELVAWLTGLSGVVSVSASPDNIVSLVSSTASSNLVGCTTSTCCDFSSLASTGDGGIFTTPCGASADLPYAKRAGVSLKLWNTSVWCDALDGPRHTLLTRKQVPITWLSIASISPLGSKFPPVRSWISPQHVPSTRQNRTLTVPLVLSIVPLRPSSPGWKRFHGQTVCLFSPCTTG